MTRAALLRADVELAAARAYPERAEHEPKWHDRIADWLVSRVARPLVRTLVDPSRRLARIVPRVAAHEAALREASDEALQDVAAHLRRQLRREGFSLEAAGYAFALVREVAQRRLGQRHFDVQLMGGWGLLQGHLVEMATGEGKTLTATLPASTAALAGVPVHIITVNDYLARRDAEAMRRVYEFLGLTVGVVVQDMTPDARREAYACDITYCTNKDLAFDYLRDRVALGNAGSAAHLALERLRGGGRTSRVVLRGLHFGIVDEADSVFIDEARTPLILSAAKGDDTETETCAQALELARSFSEGDDYTLDRRNRIVDLKEAGKDRLSAWSEDKHGAWTAKRAREELLRQALSALHLFVRDQHYVVTEGKVQIVDEFTGRIMADRSWERGLHQMIEAKEEVELTTRRDTLARITYQRLFRRYLRLAGMTGTAREVAPEVWSIFRLDVIKVPLNRPDRRSFAPGRLFASTAQKWQAVADLAERVARVERRAVLIGTRSVRASEELAQVLAARGLEHALLNAKQDREEAEIVAQAGVAGRITVATNMAGRGTDIRLPAEVVERGGLQVILTECHESARIDRQLAGRCARQGDPGSCATLVALDDELFRIHAPWVTGYARNCGETLGRSRWMLALLRLAAQAAAERHNARIRHDNLKLDRRLEKTLAFSGQHE
ncbi:MAG: preprotein translocase subunit SecA [Burkholderiales bacterium]|nr:preprotein translocase subunit SecA [Burkholderiales bacterium]